MSKKNSNWKWNAFVIAAAVAAAAAPASAQNVTLKATIPFAFSINRQASLAPGNYVVTHDRDVWRFRSEDTNKSVAIVNFSGHQGQAAEQPSLTFECLGANCELRAIRAGGGDLGAEVPAPRVSNPDKIALSLVSVALKPVQAR